MVKIMVKGVNRVTKRLADGSTREYHYASRERGAKPFWNSGMAFAVGSPEYLAALSAARPVDEKGQLAKGLFREIVLGFLASQEFKGLAPRTQRDMQTSISHPKNGIDQKFGGGPRGVFDDPRIRGRVLAWRDTIGGKVGDDRVRHLQRMVGWAVDRGLLLHHHLQRIQSVYKSNRADVFWTPEEIATFEKAAPRHIARILIAATETGLRPGDLLTLGPVHVHPTPRGRRLVVWTEKRKRLASIPVTPRMADLIDSTPAGQTRFLVGMRGEPYTKADYLGDAVSAWRDKIPGIRAELRLYDARGTAATRLLMADATLKEIATAMGWSLKHAAEVIERYAALSPEMSDGVAEKLARAGK